MQALGRVLEGTKLDGRQQRHRHIWDAVFKKKDWLIKMTEMELNPVLVGTDLTQITQHSSQGRQPYYLCLLVNDWSGDAIYEKKCLLESLYPGYTMHGDEVILANEITLNVHDISNSHISTLVEPRQLFEYETKKGNQRIFTNYIYWDDTLHRLQKLKQKKIRLVRLTREPNPTRLESLDSDKFECELKLPSPKFGIRKKRYVQRIIQAANHPRPLKD